MVEERESPSAGWREVYREMDADTNAEESTVPCPDCGRTCPHAVRNVYECDEHGVFRASASGGESADGDGRETADGCQTADECETADDEGSASADRADRRRTDRDGSEERSRRARFDDLLDADGGHRARGSVRSD
jgi:hypothetical protein